MNKKIVFIITDYGSFNNFLGELSVRLVEDGFEVSVLTSSEKVIKIKDKFNYLDRGVTFYYVDFPRSFNLISHYRTSKKIHEIIEQICPNIISIHFATAIFSTLLSGKLLFKTIGTFHGLSFPIMDKFVNRNLFKIVELFSMRRLDEIILLNKSDYSIIKSIFDKKTSLLSTKGLGCDLEVFDKERYTNSKIEKLKHSIGVESEDIVLAFTGRYVSFKGFHLVVKAFKYIEEHYKGFSLKLITIGGFDKVHLTGLSHIEKEYFHNSTNIIDIGFTSDVSDYLAISDLFVFPSKREGIPVCIIESLAMEVPVITLNSRGCNDLVEHGVNGLLLSRDSSYVDLAKEIVKLINDEMYLKKNKSIMQNNRSDLSRANFIENQLVYFNKLK